MTQSQKVQQKAFYRETCNIASQNSRKRKKEEAEANVKEIKRLNVENSELRGERDFWREKYLGTSEGKAEENIHSEFPAKSF